MAHQKAFRLNIPSSADLIRFHDACLTTPSWGTTLPVKFTDPSSVWHWLEANHRFNSLLWDEEDLARRRHVADSEIAQNKRHIDGFNQKRNDAVERIDDLLLQALANQLNPVARLHSETAGMMMDRLSILALKIKAMHAQTLRGDADAVHIAACGEKLARLNEQRGDLATCLDCLLADCASGQARYQLYRQFKMYNDPKLNPQLYAAKA